MENKKTIFEELIQSLSKQIDFNNLSFYLKGKSAPKVLKALQIFIKI